MRAVILSDSHGNTPSCDRVLAAIGQYDMIIHLGDIARDVDYLESVYYPTPVISVLGNNDFLRNGPYEKVIEFDGHKIFICHGHTLGVHRNTDRLFEAAAKNGCDAAFFGHTHRSFLEKRDGILILNPGSSYSPRYGNPSFAVLESENGKLDAVIVDWVL